MIDATRSTHNQEIVNSYVTGYNKGKLDSKIKFIEKACEWLEDNLFNYPWYDIDAQNFTANDIINDFKKAMEE